MILVTIGGKDILDDIITQQPTIQATYTHTLEDKKSVDDPDVYICKTAVFFLEDGTPHPKFTVTSRSLLSQDDAMNLSAIQCLKILENNHRFVIVDVNYEDFERERSELAAERSMYEKMKKEETKSHNRTKNKLDCRFGMCYLSLQKALRTLNEWDP